MGKRFVSYSMAGIVALSLIAAHAFKSRPPVTDSVAVSTPFASATQSSQTKHAQAKALRPAVKAGATDGAEANAVLLPPSFRILLTHSLFSSHPTVQVSRATTPTDGELTLRGVLQHGRGFVAYIENTASGQAQEVRVGEAVGAGKLVAIDLYSVRYAAQGRDMRVEVGQSFSGARTVAAAQSSALATIRQITE
jgi:hypothetical protein